MHICLDGGALPAGRTRRLGRGNLEIRDLVRQDAGLYHCALTGAPDIFAEAMLSVIGQWNTRTPTHIISSTE